MSAIEYGVAILALALVAACNRGGAASGAESCMTCHNASQANDYAGPGIENPHPFPGAGMIACSGCHGGNPDGEDADSSHVPPPPQIGDDAKLLVNDEAYFNRLTLTGIDKYPSYTVDGKTWTALDYLQFINPGDLRVVTQGRSCGKCHSTHSTFVNESMLATSTGIYSGALFTAGADNSIPAHQGLFQDTAADLAFRDVVDADHVVGAGAVGEVKQVDEAPVYSVRNANGPLDIHNNPLYDKDQLLDDIWPNGQVKTGSPLANLLVEQFAFTCGDCHLGSAGANNRYGDFRSSGCTACHMPYSLDGKSRSRDPNVDKLEPLDPDQIEAPERSHVRAHVIVSKARVGAGGALVQGIDDHTCAGCHQGSNRTVMQYWGIRLDQNKDLARGKQYPAAPATWKSTKDDPRLFDPVVGNKTFNGRDFNQYILEEDYDGDGLDDTPPDIHYEAGMGCIDCHGSGDLHGGDVAGGGGPRLLSRMEQAVAIECESCHGTISAYAPTVNAVSHDGSLALVAVDRNGKPLPHVVREGADYFLYSKLTGQRHYVPQTLDTIVQNGKVNPLTSQPVYSVKASYAMGRADGIAATGIGPVQDGSPSTGYAHTDNVSCAACHSSWQNSCIGCHLGGEYRPNGQQFSNITGQRIVFNQANADFVYQTPVPFQLGVDSKDKVAPIAPNTDMFFSWKDRNNQTSKIFVFSDRHGLGNDPSSVPYPSMAHNVMMPHSIRGKVDAGNEGPRYCVACHLTDQGLATFGTQYNALRTALSGGTPASLAGLDFDLMKEHIGENTGNQMNSPLWVHMVAGLGTGLFLFDENGCPVNPLDDDNQRVGCDGVAPKTSFDINRAALDLDRIVLEDGTPTGSNSHPTADQVLGASNRDGERMAGPLSGTLIQRLTNPTTGIVLDSWLDADGASRGEAITILGVP